MVGAGGLADAAVDSIRPGFHQRAAYNEHASAVRHVACNLDDGTFVTLDERSCHIWNMDAQDGVVTPIRELNFPRGSYLTAILFVPKLQLFLAACLEGAIHIYGPNMEPKAQLKLPKSVTGAIVDMVYNNETDELITAGESGVRVWYTAQNIDDWQFVEQAIDAPQILRGRQGPWVMGEHQDIRERMTLRVPGTLNVTSNASAANKYTKHAKPGEWVSKLYMHSSSQIVFCILGISIYGFNMETGVRVFEWEAIHTQPVTDMIYQPERNQAFTSSLEPSTVMWRVNSNTGQVQMLRSFGRHAAGVSSIQLHPRGGTMLTTCMDGMIVLWSMQSLEPIYKAKMNSGVMQAQFTRNDDFTVVMGREVRVMWLEWVQTIFAEYNSPVKSLQYLGKSLVLAGFEDTSVRIIDSTSSETLIVIAPQLSVSMHTSVLACSWRSELYVLLANGQVHCWSVQMQALPKLKQILNPDRRYRVTCAALLEGGLLNPEAGLRFGLEVDRLGNVNDYLVVGTSEGDVHFLDLSRKGEITCRLTVSKVAEISMIRIDPLRARLVTLCQRTLCVWSMEHPKVCVREVKLREDLSTMEVAHGQLWLASKSGSLTSLRLEDGGTNAVPAIGDHMGAITSMESNLVLDHLVTGGIDGRLKIFDWQKTLKVSLNLATHISAVCWLNDNGDLLSASGKRLYMIRADRCCDTYRKQSHRELYRAPRVRALKATELYSMRGGPVMDVLLTGEPYPVNLPAGSLYSSRPNTSESAARGSPGRRTGRKALVDGGATRACTPNDGDVRYQMKGMGGGRAKGWVPAVNVMNAKLLMGQPRPPTPDPGPPIRVHQGLPGMQSFGLVPPSSPMGMLKPLTPQVFREGSPSEVWRRKRITENGEQVLRVGEKSSATVQTTQDGEYVVGESWEAFERHQSSASRSEEESSRLSSAPRGERTPSSAGVAPSRPKSGKSHLSKSRSGKSTELPPLRPASREPLVTDFAEATRFQRKVNIMGSNAVPLGDAATLGANAVSASPLNPSDDDDYEESGEDGDSERLRGSDGEESSSSSDARGEYDSSSDGDGGPPRGLQGGMEEAFEFLCKHYDLSEETVRKLMEQEEMLREMAEHGRLLSPPERKKMRKKKKKKKTTATVGERVEGEEKPKKTRKKKKKKRRRKRREALALLGQEGVDALRARAQADGIVIGCHEYNAAEVETHAAFQTFMPKVPSHAKNHSKTPIGYQNRLHFPAIPTIAAKTVVHRPSSND